MSVTLKNTYISSSNQLGAGLECVGQKTFASNAVTFAGLSGDYRYELHLAITTVDLCVAALEINGDTNQAHYVEESMYAAGAVYACAALASSWICYSDNGGEYATIIEIVKTPAGYATFRSFDLRRQSVVCREYSGCKTDAAITEITSIVVTKTAVGTSINGTATLYRKSKN